jgi:TetR/AcrR family transcriptional repressor of mexJK operon
MAAASIYAREPQQARSAETTRRLIEAAQDLLETQSFDDTSVTAIAARAGVTIGAFYARFGDKAGLLRVLEANLHEAFETLADQQTVPQKWTGRAIEQALREHHETLVRTYRSHRGSARALLLKAQTDPALRKRIDKLNQRNLPLIAKALASHGKISHPEAERALQFALLAVRSVCREVLLFHQEWPGAARKLSDAVLVEELTRMVLGYLGLKASGAR